MVSTVSNRDPDEKVILVVRCTNRDLKAVRNAIHDLGLVDQQDFVFREKPSRHNAGINIFDICVVAINMILERFRGTNG